jgi:hypothetical protein
MDQDKADLKATSSRGAPNDRLQETFGEAGVDVAKIKPRGTN